MAVPSTSATVRVAPPWQAWALAVWAALSFGSGARAHDFWVQPDAFWIAAGAVTPITLQVGMVPRGSARRSPWPASCGSPRPRPTGR